MESTITKVGVNLGRFNPIHLGHEAIIAKALNENDIGVLVLGSVDQPQSLRHFFGPKTRETILKMIYPQAKIIKLADVRHLPTPEENNKQWIDNLDLQINQTIPGEKDITFYGGCYEDVDFFEQAGKKISYMNRFDGTTPKISATEVRDTLAGLILTENNKVVRRERLLEKNLVNPLIVDYLLEVFEEEWNEFKKK